MENNMEKVAGQFVNAIKTIAEKPENLENLELKNWFVYYAYGTNKQDAIKHIDLMFPCKIVSGMRVNKTDRKR